MIYPFENFVRIHRQEDADKYLPAKAAPTRHVSAISLSPMIAEDWHESGLVHCSVHYLYHAKWQRQENSVFAKHVQPSSIMLR